MQGRQVLHYKIGEKLGQGGMGEVYLAHDDKLDRDVAVKFLPQSLQQSPEARARLIREAQAASRLSHPNIVAAHAIEHADGQDFIVMEYVRGNTLSDVILTNTLTMEQSLELAHQIADALAVAHDTGVVHRDIKTSNILITDRGQAKMLDFGLATFYGATQVTDAGATMGTMSYMSPEQTQGRPIDHRSDLFSFGVVIYEMITGRRPFDGDNRNTIAFAICNNTPEPLARFKTGVPPSLENIVTKALRKDPTERYQSAADMMADIKVAARESSGQQGTTAPGPTPQTPADPYYGQQPPPGQPPYSQPPQGTPGHTPQPVPGVPQTPYTPSTPHAPAYQPQPGYSPQPPSGSAPGYAPHTPSGSVPPYPYQTPSGSAPPYAPQSKSKSPVVMIALIVTGGLIAITAIVAPRLGDKQPAEQATAVVSSSVTPDKPAAPDLIRIAVLPFDNLGGEDDEYFADGVTEEITARLASVRELGVMGRTSVEKYKKTKKPVPEVGRELGVDYVLAGTVRWQRGNAEVNRVRVTPELTRVADGTNVWANVYDEPMTAVFKVQSSIAKSVVSQLDVAINEPEKQALEVTPTQNVEAYDAYLKGMKLKDNWNSPQDMRVAVSQFERAVTIDPDFLLAFVRLSEVHADMVWFNHDMSDHRVEASRRAAQRAIELDSESADAKWAMGWFYYHGKHDFKNALRYLEPALKQKPNSAEAHAAVAFVQRRQGRFDEAIANLETAAELNPQDVVYWYSAGETYSIIRQYPKAFPLLDRAMEIRPEFPYSQLTKTVAYILQGDLLKARRESGALTDVFGVDKFGALQAWVEFLLHDFDKCFVILENAGPIDNNSLYRPTAVTRALVHLAVGNKQEARTQFEIGRDEALERLTDGPNDFRYHGTLGVAYAGLGIKDDAMRHANRALELMPPSQDQVRAGDRRIDLATTLMLLGDYEDAIDQIELLLTRPAYFSRTILMNDPLFDPIRSHPRIITLLGNS